MNNNLKKVYRIYKKGTDELVDYREFETDYMAQAALYFLQVKAVRHGEPSDIWEIRLEETKEDGNKPERIPAAKKKRGAKNGK